MNSVLPRHFRGLFVAILTLGLSATIVLAGQPAGSNNGHQSASHADQSEAPDASEAPESCEAQYASEAHVGSETPDTNAPTGSNDHCAIDPTTLTPEQLAVMNHGSIVCWAAQQPTPDGYANHGQWVSHWAKMKFDANGQPILKTNHGKSAHNT
jgi:hypothetical protein